MEKTAIDNRFSIQMNNWMGQTFKYKRILKWYKCFIHYHKGWISIQVALLIVKQKSGQTASSNVISIWIWPLWRRRCTIWLLLRSEVLSTHLKQNIIYYKEVQLWPDPTPKDPLPTPSIQHRAGITLVQGQHISCKGINSLDLHLPLTGSSSVKSMANGFIYEDDLPSAP